MDSIELKGMRFYGYHGVFPEENRLGQQFIVDVKVALDLRLAGQSDALEDTVSYPDIYHTVQAIVEGEPLKLVEALAERIAQTVLDQYTKVIETTVRVVKPHPPFAAHFDGVTVEMTRRRSGQ